MEVKNTLWHFGDSFGCWQNNKVHLKHTTKGYSNYIAKHFNLNHQHRAQESLSNAQIISRIITEIPNFKKGDFVLINWSFFDRFPVMTEPHNAGRIISLNSFLTKEVDGVADESYTKEYLEYNILHRGDFQQEEWNILFWLFLLPTIRTINQLGFKVFASFNNNVYGGENRAIQEIALNGCDELAQTPKYNLPMKILTENYIKVLHDNNWYGDGNGCVHYKKGIQKELSKWWIKQIEKSKKKLI